MSKEIEFWGWNDGAERLTHTCQEDAIVDFIECYQGSDRPASVELTGYARMKASVPLCFSPLEVFVELHADDEMLDPEGYFDGVTPELRAAEKAFLDAIEEHYQYWGCEVIKTETVRIPPEAWD